MSLLLKKVSCNVCSYVAVSHCAKRIEKVCVCVCVLGGGRWGFLIYQWNHVQIYSHKCIYHHTQQAAGKEGKRAAHGRDDIEKIDLFEFERFLL